MRSPCLRLCALSSSLLVLLSLAACGPDAAGLEPEGPAAGPGPAAVEGNAPSNEATDSTGPTGRTEIAELALEAPVEVLTRRGEFVTFEVKVTGSAWSEVTLTLADGPSGVTLEKTKDKVGSLTFGADANAPVGDFELTLVATSGMRSSSRKIVLTVADLPGSFDTTFGKSGKVTGHPGLPIACDDRGPVRAPARSVRLRAVGSLSVGQDERAVRARAVRHRCAPRTHRCAQRPGSVLRRERLGAARDRGGRRRGAAAEIARGGLHSRR